MGKEAGRMSERLAREDFRKRQHAAPHPLRSQTTQLADVHGCRQSSTRGGLAGVDPSVNEVNGEAGCVDDEEDDAAVVEGRLGRAAAAAAARGVEGVSTSADPPPELTAEERRRVIVHFDADCFYCQVEELRDPSLADRPSAVTQKYLIVTANYRARAAGLTKLMATSEAKRLCPEVALISGEDLTPYRRCAKRFRRALQRFGPCEKLGLDECWVDVTEEVERRIRAGGPAGDPPLIGHCHVAVGAIEASNRHRPMDVRAVSSRRQPVDNRDVDVSTRLRVGAAIAAEARQAVRAEVGLRCSAGVATNKLCAKLVSGLHKPDDQTTLPASEACDTIAPLPVRALAGVGSKLERELMQRGLRTAAEVRAVSRAELCRWLGARVGSRVHDAAWGVDRDPVVEKPPPRAVTCEDSFRACSSYEAVGAVLAVLSPDLVARMEEEWEDEVERTAAGGRPAGRVPATLTVKWRLGELTDEKRAGQKIIAGARGGSGGKDGAKAAKATPEVRKWGRTSASTSMPRMAADPAGERRARVEAVAAAAMSILRRSLPERFNLKVINLGATNFRPEGLPGEGGAARLGVFKRPGGGGGAAADATSDGAVDERSGSAQVAMTRRRDYDRSCGAAVITRSVASGGSGGITGGWGTGAMMSKTEERATREGREHGIDGLRRLFGSGATATAVSTLGGGPTVGSSVGASFPFMDDDSIATGFATGIAAGCDDEDEDEDDGAAFFADLAGLHGMSRRGCVSGGADVTAGEAPSAFTSRKRGPPLATDGDDFGRGIVEDDIRVSRPLERVVSFWCDRCERKVEARIASSADDDVEEVSHMDVTRRAEAEHGDWHVAQDLQEEVNREVPGAATGRARASTLGQSRGRGVAEGYLRGGSGKVAARREAGVGVRVSGGQPGVRPPGSGTLEAFFLSKRKS